MVTTVKKTKISFILCVIFVGLMCVFYFFYLHESTVGMYGRRDDDFLRDDLSRLTSVLGLGCTPRDNVCFVKTRKTGSTTLSSIMSRYGYFKNLSFGLLKMNNISGHFNILPLSDQSPKTQLLPPLNVKPGDWANYKYNMMAVHVRYNRSAFDSFMQPGTKYITILREPSSQYESAFAYYRLETLVKRELNRYMSQDAAIVEYMKKPYYYWAKTEGMNALFIRNAQIFDLGLDHAYHENKTIVSRHIKKIQREFDLVMMTEYFLESMVLLKKLLCWDWDDVVYLIKNARPTHSTSRRMAPELKSKIIKWNHADYMLYKQLNRTFWKKVAAYGTDMQRDMMKLRMRIHAAESACVSNTSLFFLHGRTQVHYKTPSNASDQCRILTGYHHDVVHRIMDKQSSGYYTDVTSIYGATKVCGFEYQSKCGFNVTGSDVYQWNFNNEEDRDDVTTNSNQGTFVTAKLQNIEKLKNSTGPLMSWLSTLQHKPGNYCLNFHYFAGSTLHTLSNSILRICVMPAALENSKMEIVNYCKTIWSSTTNRPSWTRVAKSFKSSYAFKVVFETIRDGSLPTYVIDFGLDDISITPNRICH